MFEKGRDIKVFIPKNKDEFIGIQMFLTSNLLTDTLIEFAGVYFKTHEEWCNAWEYTTNNPRVKEYYLSLVKALPYFQKATNITNEDLSYLQKTLTVKYKEKYSYVRLLYDPYVTVLVRQKLSNCGLIFSHKKI